MDDDPIFYTPDDTRAVTALAKFLVDLMSGEPGVVKEFKIVLESAADDSSEAP